MIARLARLLTFLVCLAVTGPAAAQDASLVPDEWRDVAERAESILSGGRASSTMLEALRTDLVRWRTRFEAAEETNAARIATLRDEIDALGPVPTEGEVELPEIADQRAELNQRLEELLAPVRRAEVARTRADGLVAETDRLIEAERAAAVLRVDPAPINPVHWPGALRATSDWVGELWSEIRMPFATPEARAEWQLRGVELGVLVFVGTLLLWRSGVWLGRLQRRLLPSIVSSPLLRLAMIGVSLAMALLPVAGLLVVMRIVDIGGGDTLRLSAAQTVVPIMGLIVLLSRWLSYQAFPIDGELYSLLLASPAVRREGRVHGQTLGVTLAFSVLVEAMTRTGLDDAAARALLHLGLLIVAGLTLVRLGQLLLAQGHLQRDAEDGPDGIWPQTVRLIGRLLIVIGLVAPVAAATGYVNLALSLTWPTVASLGLIVFVATLQTVVFDVWAAVTRRSDAARDALAPTLVGFGLALASLPAFALIWGVRPSRLGEWWGTFLRGFEIGETRISPSIFLTFVAVFAVGYLLTRLVKGVLKTNVLPKTKLDSGGTNAILSGTGYIGVTLAALLAITTAGIDLSGLAIVAGALSVGLGFGLQNIVQNFVSGIILLVERPIKIGDWINVNGLEGFVQEISVRSTRIETFDRQDVIVPNADLISGTVTNYTLGNSAGRVVLQIGVAYGTDTRRVHAVLQEVAEAHPMVILNPPPLITFDGFGADSLNFTIRMVLRDILFKVVVASEVNHLIAERFAAEGFEIPFAQRDVWLRNPEALNERAPSEPERRSAAESPPAAPKPRSEPSPDRHAMGESMSEGDVEQT
jgi:small-conductance mechanosensitive channel